MGIRLGANSYGKAGNHLFKVVRATDRHEVRDYRVDIALTGDYDAAHVEGDNTEVLATDTMRNTVYAIAAQHEFDCPSSSVAISSTTSSPSPGCTAQTCGWSNSGGSASSPTGGRTTTLSPRRWAGGTPRP